MFPIRHSKVFPLHSSVHHCLNSRLILSCFVWHKYLNVKIRLGLKRERERERNQIEQVSHLRTESAFKGSVCRICDIVAKWQITRRSFRTVVCPFWATVEMWKYNIMDCAMCKHIFLPVNVPKTHTLVFKEVNVQMFCWRDRCYHVWGNTLTCLGERETFWGSRIQNLLYSSAPMLTAFKLWLTFAQVFQRLFFFFMQRSVVWSKPRPLHEPGESHASHLGQRASEHVSQNVKLFLQSHEQQRSSKQEQYKTLKVKEKQRSPQDLLVSNQWDEKTRAQIRLRARLLPLIRQRD